MTTGTTTRSDFNSKRDILQVGVVELNNCGPHKHAGPPQDHFLTDGLTLTGADAATLLTPSQIAAKPN
jgi:hypothetical protein